MTDTSDMPGASAAADAPRAGGQGFVDLGDGVTLEAPGLVLDARLVPARPLADESLIAADPQAALDPPAAADPLDAAAAASGLATERVLAVTVAEPPGPPAPAAAPEGLTLAVPPPTAGTAQVLRYQDAAGLWHWVLPEPGTGEAASTRFAVPRAALDTAAPPAGPAVDEGLVGAIVGKVVHRLMVYAYPVVDRLLDPFVDNLAQQREVAAHPYGVRTFTPDNFAVPRPPDATVNSPEQWAQLAGGRALLLIHGTFSSTHGGFGGLDAATVAALNEAYAGRVIAFDHPTVSVSLAANVDALYRLTDAPGPLDVDILAHSRGGLVARELVRRQTAPDAKYRVRRVVFAATPNRGTPLADPDHVVRFIDRYTNLLTLLPGPAEVVGDTLAGLMTAVQILGHAALRDLDGLGAMCPGGGALAALSAGAPGTEYFGIHADFEPGDELAARLRAGDLLMDAVFPEANDLVVPSGGVCLRDPAAGVVAAGFPIPDERTLTFAAERAVWHCSLFAQPETRTKLVEWLRP
jgi:hypothetical protein